MIRPIVKYGDPILTQKAEPVIEFNEELKQLIEDMYETMYNAPGVGLAAPQIGISKRIFIMDCSSEKEKPKRVTFINPKIVSTEGSQTGDEGCLSFPGIYFEVTRPQHVVVEAQDVDGQKFTLNVSNLEARCVCHENDHLDGELYIEYLSPLKKELVKRKIKKKIKSGNW